MEYLHVPSTYNKDNMLLPKIQRPLVSIGKHLTIKTLEFSFSSQLHRKLSKLGRLEFELSGLLTPGPCMEWDIQ